jgi:hypothetical protein
METHENVTDVARPAQNSSVENHVALFSRDPEQAFKEAQRLVNIVAGKCSGPGYMVNIKGKLYPKIEWWTTISASLGMFPQVVFAKRLDREDEVAYEAKVAVYRQDQIIASGEAMCSSKETRWENADEYAIKSMAITRASGKAYRIPLSFLAVMAGLEATPAEEMARDNPVSGELSQGSPATDKQISKLGDLLNDDRLTYEEQTKLRGALQQGLTKSRASEIMSHFFGESKRQDGQWVRVSEGVLTSRQKGT